MKRAIRRQTERKAKVRQANIKFRPVRKIGIRGAIRAAIDYSEQLLEAR